MICSLKDPSSHAITRAAGVRPGSSVKGGVMPQEVIELVATEQEYQVVCECQVEIQKIILLTWRGGKDMVV